MEVEFLGMIVGHGCIHMDPAKLSAIAAWPPPKTVKAVRALLSVMVRGRGLFLSVVHLPPLTMGSPLTFTVLVIFFDDTFCYIVW